MIGIYPPRLKCAIDRALWNRKRAEIRMTIEEYLLKWIPQIYGIQPSERGFRARCLDELSKITGVSRDSIHANWGSGITFQDAPSYVERIINLQDVVNQAHMVRKHLDHDLDSH